MISYLIIFYSLIFKLFPNKKDLKNKKLDLYSLIFFSLLISHLILGFISLLLLTFHISKFPVLYISFFILGISIIFDKEINYKFKIIKDFFSTEIRKLKEKNQNKFQKFTFYLILLFLILITLSSIGPINHPDASDYHVGYPYQYFIRGEFFIDGGLHQGLLGLADYANFAFIQEKSTWLIRTVQIINLPFLILFLSNRIKYNLFILALLTTPTFFQWSTIGKPMFLGESCLIAIFIIWETNKSKFNLKFLLTSSIACIAFKITSLIIIVPIFSMIFFNFIKNKTSKKEILKDFIEIISSKIFILTVLSVLLLLFNRFQITGNFAYPLLTNIFNKQDILINEFSELLQSYGRDINSIIGIFFPLSLSDISQSLGLFIVFIIIFFFIQFKTIYNLKTYKNLWLIAFSQLLLLLLFSQVRSDYYASPLILFTYLSSQIQLSKIDSYLYKIFQLNILIQVLIFSSFISISIFQNLNGLLNYEEFMNKTAFGFSSSQIIEPNKLGRILFTTRNTRLFYPENYLDKDLMSRCIIENSSKIKPNSQSFCLDKYKVNQIISNKNYLDNNDAFKCINIKLKSGSRNPFNRVYLKQNYCERNKKLK